MNTRLVTAVAVALVAASSAQPFGRGGLLQDNTIDPGDFASRAPPGDVEAWMAAVGPHVLAPEDAYLQGAGPSLYDDFHPPAPQDLQAALTRTIWFESYPHGQAVLNWQRKRLQQGLPVYRLNSQRPGFPFYRGN